MRDRRHMSPYHACVPSPSSFLMRGTPAAMSSAQKVCAPHAVARACCGARSVLARPVVQEIGSRRPFAARYATQRGPDDMTTDICASTNAAARVRNWRGYTVCRWQRRENSGAFCLSLSTTCDSQLPEGKGQVCRGWVLVRPRREKRRPIRQVSALVVLCWRYAVYPLPCFREAV